MVTLKTMQQVLTIENLIKNYPSVRALKDLSLTVRKGDIYGILGPNGSGKTTTLGIILGVTNPSAGSFSWFEEGNGYHLRKRIGAMLDKPSFYPHMNAWQNLGLTSVIKGISSPDVTRVLELTGVDVYAKRKFGTYSTGMKQRLALASTLLGNPEVLVLDEPTNGLDPEGIADVRGIISRIAGEGVTVILASHLLDEVQKVCTHVAVLKAGQKLYEGQVASLLAGDDRIEISSDNPAKLEEALNKYEGIEKIEKNLPMFSVRLKDGFKVSELSAYLIMHGVDITHLAHNKGSLEKEFLKLLSEDRD